MTAQTLTVPSRSTAKVPAPPPGLRARRGRALIATGCAALALALSAACAPARAQTADPTYALAVRSAIVVLGTVTKAGASEEPLLAPTDRTVVITIERMFAGAEFAGDQAGRTATVILSRPAGFKAGTQALFFGNPRFLGKTLTFADEGEVPIAQGTAGALPPALAQGLQARRDAPVRARLALAAMVFRGTVESVQPLEGGGDRGQGRDLRDEHDPDWQLATVRVTSALRGTENGALVAVVFPASRDIIWFNSPKLGRGEDWLILAHRPQEDEVRLLRTTGALAAVDERHALVVSQPFDTLPPEEEKRVVELLRTQEVQR